jgi:hypothetical protein
MSDGCVTVDDIENDPGSAEVRLKVGELMEAEGCSPEDLHARRPASPSLVEPVSALGH